MKFILVDDDDLTNLLHDIILKETLGEEVDIEIFSDPEKGLAFIQNAYGKYSGHTVLFLDINMPRIDGWEFLEAFESFDDKVKAQISIYILSSSLDSRDSNKAAENKNVKGFFSKPLTNELILSIAGSEF